MASIRVIQGPDKGRTFDLRAGDNVVGRENGATIVLNDQTASRAHSCIRVDNGQSLLSDVGSANGTFLNGVKIGHPTALKRGDQVRCGSTLLVYQGDAAVPSPVVGERVDIEIVRLIPDTNDEIKFQLIRSLRMRRPEDKDCGEGSEGRSEGTEEAYKGEGQERTEGRQERTEGRSEADEGEGEARQGCAEECSA